MLYPPNPFPVFIPALMWLLVGPFYIRYLSAKTFGQYIREDGPQSHHKKAGTPTAGGVLILITVLVAMLGFMAFVPQLATPNILWLLLVLIVFGLLGFSDDYLKITKQKNKGLSGWSKLAIQVATSGALGAWVFMQGQTSVSLFGMGSFDLGWLYPLFVILVMTGASNAYNLTDGLDGLAGGTGTLTFVGFAFMFAGTHPDLMLFSLLLAGGCLGFLAFNRHPAKIFMGDTGSLALGGVMGALAVLGKIEMFLLLLGGIYVIETLSVMLQVSYFKATKGKRLFKMSPLHHHFELSGWKEPTVVLTFTMAQALLSVIAVLLYNRG